MKKLLIMAFASLLSPNSYSLDVETNPIVYTLAHTIYRGDLSAETSGPIKAVNDKKEKKVHALRIQKEAQGYFQTKIASIYLESKIQMAKELDKTLSDLEAVDLLIEASYIILAQ